VNTGDLHALRIPWYQYSARAVLGEGRLPLWDSHQLCGTPVLGLGYTAALYPPILLLFATLPPWSALQLHYAFHILLLGWGLTAYLRRHGIGRLPAGIATLIAVATVFRMPLLAGVDQPPFLASVAWIPAILLCWERAAERPGARAIGWLALALAAPWLPGYPDFALVIPVLLGVVALVSDTGRLRTRLATLVVAWSLSIALVAIQLVPLAEVVAESPRAIKALHDVRYRNIFAVLSWEHFAHILSFRLGIAPVILALLGAWPLTRLRLAWLAALVWSIFALNLPFRLLYLLPPYAGVRFPFGWSGASAVFLGILVACGLVGLWRRNVWWARVLVGGLGVAAVAHGLAVVAGAPGAPPGFRPAPGFRAPDLVLAAQRARQLRELIGEHDSGDRIVSEREVTSGSTIRNRLPSLTGHSPSAPPRRVVALLRHLELYDSIGLYRARAYPRLAADPHLAALLGVGFAVLPPRHAQPLLAAGFSAVGSLPPNDVVLHRPALPRVRLVHRVIEASGEAGTFAAVVDAAAGATGVAVVETGALSAPLVELAMGTTEQVRVVRYEPERVEIDAVVAAPALLVLTDTFYPGWRATLDGVAVPILRADHAFRGLRLEAGRHRVVFFYAPDSVRAGAIISLAAAGIAICCLGWPSGRRKRAAAHGNEETGP
jgi:hypothetical protein